LASTPFGKTQGARWDEVPVNTAAESADAVPQGLELGVYMPPGVVEHEQDVFALACPHSLGEVGEGERESRD
jgi:hypothetical protein